MGISPREVVRQDADDGKEPEETGEEGAGEDVEAEANVEFKPLIDLPDLVETKTGEEDEDVIFKMRTKMFRFVESSKEWKERGTGDVRFLRHKENKKIRVLMRAEKTLRVRANHPLSEKLDLKAHAGSDRAFTYFTPDWSEDPETGLVEQQNELFAFRFANPENAKIQGCLREVSERRVRRHARNQAGRGGRREGNGKERLGSPCARCGCAPWPFPPPFLSRGTQIARRKCLGKIYTAHTFTPACASSI